VNVPEGKKATCLKPGKNIPSTRKKIGENWGEKGRRTNGLKDLCTGKRDRRVQMRDPKEKDPKWNKRGLAFRTVPPSKQLQKGDPGRQLGRRGKVVLVGRFMIFQRQQIIKKKEGNRDCLCAKGGLRKEKNPWRLPNPRHGHTHRKKKPELLQKDWRMAPLGVQKKGENFWDLFYWQVRSSREQNPGRRTGTPLLKPQSKHGTGKKIGRKKKVKKEGETTHT